MQTDEIRFDAELSGTIRVMTVVVWISIALATIALVVTGLTEGPRGMIALAVIVPATLGVTWAFHPKGYVLTRDSVEIVRPIGSVMIRTQDIESVAVAPDLMRFPTLRVMGSGGFHGVYGRFWRKGVGMFTSYVTDPDATVRIDRRGGRPIAVSPQNCASFVEHLRSRIASSR